MGGVLKGLPSDGLVGVVEDEVSVVGHGGGLDAGAGGV